MRGGGLYACGFAVTFLSLEIGSLADDVMGIGQVFNGEAISFVINFIIESFKNTWLALMWPAKIISFAQPWGAVGLGVAFWLFPIYVKPHIERWLFDGEEDANNESDEVA